MMNLKLILTVCSFAATVSALEAQTLRFREDGTFKIVQITDTHIVPDHPETEVPLRVTREALAAERPDLVVLTGDIVTGRPARRGWQLILNTLTQADIPFLVLNGNHDTEQELTYAQIAHLVTSVPRCLNTTNGQGELADKVLEIKSNDGARTEALLYCMDSHCMSQLPQVGGYGWFRFEQVKWYREESNRYTQQNGGHPFPALAFFHIPLQEYGTAYQAPGSHPVGIRLENECPADINPGLFAALLEQGDVMATFVGHDHNNDYIARHYGIDLCYGRFSGGKTTYTDVQPGVRVITLYEGQRNFSTYVRLDGGQILHPYTHRDVSFAVAADLHFDLLPETDQYYHVRALNRLEGNFVWPADVPAFAGDTLRQLSAVVLAGDIFDKALPETHALYKARYHQGEGDKRIHYPVYPGYGNHDIDPDSKHPDANLKGRQMNLQYLDSVLQTKLDKGEILNYDPESRAYSWNIEGVHFVHMQTYAGDTAYTRANSLDWLADDLQRYAPGQTPVVYIQHYGFDEWAIKWWPQDKRERLFDILDRHRLAAFFVGHTHTPSVQQYRGHDIYQVNNAWPDGDGNGSFAVVRMKGDTIGVSTCRWTDGEGHFETVLPVICKPF